MKMESIKARHQGSSRCQGLLERQRDAFTYLI